MRSLICIGVFASTIPFARAHPDGAPWGAARPTAAETCNTCHFDNEPIHDSTQLQIEGLPYEPEPGETYDLTISLQDLNAVTAGFQLIAEADQAGAFVSTAANMEFIGPAIRSTQPAKSNGAVSWSLQWQVPPVFAGPIVLYVAATSANDDGSPLGDKIHFRSYTLPQEEPEPDR